MSRSGSTVVVGADRGIGRSIAESLERSGEPVFRVGDDLDLTDPVAVADALAAARRTGPVGRLVLCWLPSASFRVRPIVDLDEGSWDEMGERALRAAFVVLQAAHGAIADGGRVIVVLPTIGSVGVSGLVPVCSAVEGIRVMAKSMARRWGARSITVNTIEVDLEGFLLGDRDADAGSEVPAVPAVPVLGTPALPPGSVVDDVLAVITLLDAAEADAITGTLFVADRGTVMLP